ncbi:unnamed protein product, partial [Leptidea sinapis]
MEKITELIRNLNEFSFSFEVTPDVNRGDLDGLNIKPLFFSITWHAKKYEMTDLNIPPIQLAEFLRDKQKNVLLHLSCDRLRRAYLNKLLDHLKAKEICNLLLVRGEGYDSSSSDFKSTSELITHVRQYSGNYFCIGIVGHADRNDRYQSLKLKVDAGADFIITQAFFDVNVYKIFVSEAKKLNINIPTIPGLFPFETREELDGFINLCKVHVEENLIEKLVTNTGVTSIKDIATGMYKAMH